VEKNAQPNMCLLQQEILYANVPYSLDRSSSCTEIQYFGL
jgi:hypothetical protein